jgi:hypothetical protein
MMMSKEAWIAGRDHNSARGPLKVALSSKTRVSLETM